MNAARLVGQHVTLACLLEVAAPKVGNVHRGADFEDLTFLDLAASGVAIAPAMEAACQGAPIGETVLRAVQATRERVDSNTNLGIILLLAPLAKAAGRADLRRDVQEALNQLDAADSAAVYEAIRLAQPGGLSKVEQADVAGPPPDDLLAAMRLAADRDLVARQWSSGFAEVLDFVAPAIQDALRDGRPLLDAIVYAQLKVMSRYPDSLIARKCGTQIAQQSADRAQHVLDLAEGDEQDYLRAAADLDFWLRSDGHRRNPGSTADLITAGLFVGLQEGWIKRLAQ